jgi:hypothetical protein
MLASRHTNDRDRVGHIQLCCNSRGHWVRRVPLALDERHPMSPSINQRVQQGLMQTRRMRHNVGSRCM